MLLTSSAQRPPAARNWKKNRSEPCRVMGASWHHPACTRPPGVSTGHDAEEELHTGLPAPNG